MEHQRDCIVMANEPRICQLQDPETLLELAPDGRTPRTQTSSCTASAPRTPPSVIIVPTLKKAKPPPFSGENTSLAIVNAWIFKIRAYVRASTDEEEKVETAASFLTGMAELWFMPKYVLAAQLSTFDKFIQAFKARFTHADDACQLRPSIESMTPGFRSILEYHAEFQTVISQIGEDVVDMDWAHLHFEQGLTTSICHHVAINGCPTDSLDDLTTLGQRVFNVNRQLAKENLRTQWSDARAGWNFRIHEQGESTRLKIYFYVTTI